MPQTLTSSIGCYVHLPFCARKCLFCSFVVAIGQEGKMPAYVQALLREARQFSGCRVRSVYLGGGTPSSLSDDDLTRLMEGLRELYVMDPKAETTIEVNPEHVTAQKVSTLKCLGFNRISLGVQTFHDHYLKFLGRHHDAAQARHAFDVIRRGGFDNINVDLMYGFPGQSFEEISQDLAKVCALHSDHVSLYTLTIEPQSRFYATQMKLDDDDVLARQFTMAKDALARAGLCQYEISNFSRKGFESMHNQHYWQGGEYLGLGVGAHGYLKGRRFWKTDKLHDYLKDPVAVKGFEDLDERTKVLEKVCFGLRTTHGIDAAIIPEDRRDMIALWVKEGLLARCHGRVVATDAGQLILDELSARLM